MEDSFMSGDRDIVKQLRLAEIWFVTDSEATVPVDRAHGKWLLQTAADTIERQSAMIRILETKLDAAKGYVTPKKEGV